MAQVEITATKDDATATVTYDFGDDCSGANELFGEDVVHSGFVKSSKITAQSAIRRYLQAGLDESAIQDKMSAWKPGVAMERVSDPVGTIKSKFAGLSDEDKLDLIKQLKASAGK